MKRIVSTLFLVAVLIFGLQLFNKHLVVSAKTVSNVITSLTVTDSTGNNQPNEFGQWETFRINATFELPNNEVSAEDTTTIAFPQNIMYKSPNRFFDIQTNQGEVVAKAEVFGDEKKIVLTYTDYVEKHSNIKGSFYFDVSFDHTIQKDQTRTKLSFNVEGQTIVTDEVGYTGVGKGDGTVLVKGGWPEKNEPRQLGYDIAVNRTKEAYTNAVLTDEFAGKGNIIPESVHLYRGTWTYDDTISEWRMNDAVDVTPEFAGAIDIQPTKMTVNLGNIEPNQGYYLTYKVRLDETPEIGDVFVNKVRLTADNGVDIPQETGTMFIQAHGEAEGQNFTIRIHKQDPNGQVLQGAEFQVIRKRNQAVVGTLTTDENGDASVGQLLKDDYIIKETKAPEGYEKSDEEIVVNYDDFGADLAVWKAIVNQKIEVTEVAGQKTWVDEDNKDGKRPEQITVRLLADGKEVANQVVTAASNWTYTFSDLPKYADGKEIVYTIDEDHVEFYEEKVEGYNVTNTYVPGRPQTPGKPDDNTPGKPQDPSTPPSGDNNTPGGGGSNDAQGETPQNGNGRSQSGGGQVRPNGSGSAQGRKAILPRTGSLTNIALITTGMLILSATYLAKKKFTK